MYKVTILLSGGIDSSVLLAWCSDQGIECQPLFVDYGQVTAPRELSAAEKVSKHYKYSLESVEIPNVSHITRNQITDPANSTNPFYPNRNLLLLTIGSLHAFENKNQGVGIGAIRAMNSTPFPDVNPTFFNQFSTLVETSLNFQLAIVTPFIDLTKTEVVKIGQKLQVPFKLTYSCLTNKEKPCGNCESCISRREALEE